MTGGPAGRRIYRKRVIGTVEEYVSAEAARHAVKGLLAEQRSSPLCLASAAMTMAELCFHFQQHEQTHHPGAAALVTGSRLLQAIP
jgi:hypothetical protein